uniref:Uncharacterized protein n=1 Tax=Oryza nivara TaxID=4536 RepID=A0A0E0HWG2_ORYNI
MARSSRQEAIARRRYNLVSRGDGAAVTMGRRCGMEEKGMGVPGRTAAMVGKEERGRERIGDAGG